MKFYIFADVVGLWKTGQQLLLLFAELTDGVSMDTSCKSHEKTIMREGEYVHKLHFKIANRRQCERPSAQNRSGDKATTVS